jgi:hypothetical protein
MDDISFCGRMSTLPLSATMYKKKQICWTTKKDDEHWATVNEAASMRNGDQPVHDYFGEDEQLNSVFVGALRVSIHIVIEGVGTYCCWWMQR